MDLQPFVWGTDSDQMAGLTLEPSLGAKGRGGGGGRGRGRGGQRGPGQHSARRPAPGAGEEAKPGSDFWDRILRPNGRNVTKVGSQTNPRDVASQIAAQARADGLPYQYWLAGE